MSHVNTECPRRKVNCQYCHDTGEHQFIEGQHKVECLKLPLPCPNKCEVGNIPRDALRKHLNFCPLQLIQCKYHIVGCKAIITRKDQKEHSKKMVEEHLSLSVNELTTNRSLIEQSLTNQNEANKTISNKLSSAEKEITTLKQQFVTLTNCSNKILDKTEMKFQPEQKGGETKVVLQKTTLSEENLANLSSGLIFGLIGVILALLFSLYIQHIKTTGLETELKRCQDRINEVKKWITQDLLLQLQRLDNAHNTTMLQVENTILEIVSAVNETSLMVIDDLKAQLPFLFCFSGYTEYQKELLEKSLSDQEILDSQRSPIIMKISGISIAVTSDYYFNQSRTVGCSKGFGMTLLVQCFNTTHIEVMLFSKQPPYKEYSLWSENLTVTILNQINDKDHYILNSRYFKKIQPLYSLSLVIAIKDIFINTPNCQYVVCNSILFSIDYPDFCLEDESSDEDPEDGNKDYLDQWDIDEDWGEDEIL